jgi:hypothetical protein
MQPLHDVRFRAIPSRQVGPTTVAFESITDRQSVGVGVSGTVCGVFGSSSIRQGSRPASTVGGTLGATGIGVAGIGDSIGVWGSGPLALKGDGESIGLLATAAKVCVLAQHTGSGTILPETCAVAAEAQGSGRSAVGLRAWSAFNRAGVFGTGVGQQSLPAMQLGTLIAQIHLVPVPDTPAPPPTANAGDLIAIQHKDERQQAVTELHFCIRSSSPGFPAGWSKIA